MGPFVVSPGAAIAMNGGNIQVNLAFRFGVLRREKLRAAQDLKQIFTNGATSWGHSAPMINPPTWDHFNPMIKLLTEKLGRGKFGIPKADRSEANTELPLVPSRK